MKSGIKKGCGFLLGTVLLLGIAVAIVIYVRRPKWKDEYGQRFTDVAYGSREHNTYDLYLPNGAAQKDSLALILYVHGGSWIGGDKHEHHGDCYTWVQKGYVTATMNYSLLQEEGASIPVMIEEIASCIEQIIGFAAEKNVHIRQMAICGTSAGGHLAMMYAYGHSHQLPLRFTSIKVGPADLRILFPYDKNAKAEDIENFVFSCTGKRMSASSLTPEVLDSIKLRASPVLYINDSTALPSIFAYGGKDWLVKPDHYLSLQLKYDSLGKPYDLIVFPNSWHTLMDDKDCTMRYDSTMSDYCNKYFGY
jgi:acetyl esterase/lipase